MNCRPEDMLLYAVTDRAWLNGETLESQVEKALKGGATFVQLREKELDEEKFLEEAKKIKKQLNRMVEVIKVIDLTDVPIHMKEILFAKVLRVNAAEKEEVFQIAQVFNVQVADIGNDSVLLECKLTARRNNELIALLKSKFKMIEVVRGGAVAIESISTSCR